MKENYRDTGLGTSSNLVRCGRDGTSYKLFFFLQLIYRAHGTDEDRRFATHHGPKIKQLPTLFPLVKLPVLYDLIEIRRKSKVTKMARDNSSESDRTEVGRKKISPAQINYFINYEFKAAVEVYIASWLAE